VSLSWSFSGWFKIWSMRLLSFYIDLESSKLVAVWRDLVSKISSRVLVRLRLAKLAALDDFTEVALERAQLVLVLKLARSSGSTLFKLARSSGCFSSNSNSLFSSITYSSYSCCKISPSVGICYSMISAFNSPASSASLSLCVFCFVTSGS